MSGSGLTANVPQAPAADLAQELEALGLAPGSYDVRPLTTVRRTIARRMTESFRDVPHFWLKAKLEVDAMQRSREARNAAAGAAVVSFNDMLIKAAALALKDYPRANASYTPRGLLYHHNADIAVAVALEDGLVTPIVRRADEKSLTDISAEMKDLAVRAKAKRLRPEEYMGGTFSLSNLGMYGVSSFGSVLNPPQGCILSIGRPEQQFRFRGDDAYTAAVLEVTLTCDHRAVDGAIGAQWLQAFARRVEQPQEWAFA